jgi:hypothetical protein
VKIHFNPYIRHTKILFKMLLMLRGLLSEHKIPPTLFERLKHYVPEFSEAIPNIERINYFLEQDINYLNGIEEFLTVLQSSKCKIKNLPLFNIKKNTQSNSTKYYSIRMVEYKDIIELNSIIDRVLIFDIDMSFVKPKSIEGLLKKYAACTANSFYYSIKLSSLQ